jgi:hypothetical protein
MASRFQRLIGGLLGEDVEAMSEEDRKRLAREGSMSALAGMLTGSGLLGGLSAYGERRAKGAQQAAAEAALPDIASRILGGRTGTMIEDVEGGPATPLMAQRVPSAEGAREALRMMYGTQAGRSVAATSPDLLKLAQEGVSGRTVGGAVYNPLTGEFSRPPVSQVKTLTPAEIREMGLPTGTVAQVDQSGKLEIVREPPRVSGPSSNFLTLTEQEIEAAGLPKGTVAQRNALTGEIKIVSAIPPAERTAISNRERSLKRVEAGVENIENQLEKITTGGFIGFSGALSRITDSQDAKEFETYREQLSNALRTALRIPGEGTLSDREQAQYGLTLPSLSLSKERNIKVMRAIEDQVRISADMPMIAEEMPEEEGLDEMTWRMMTPSERAAYKRAGAKK